MEKQKHSCRTAIIAFALILSLLLPAMSGTLVPAAAAEAETNVEALELNPILRVGGGFDSPLTSSIDAINIWRKASQVNKTGSGRLAVQITLMQTDLSDIEQYYVRMSYPTSFTTYTKPVEFGLVDGNNIMYGWRDDGDVAESAKGYMAEVTEEGKPESAGTAVPNKRVYWCDQVKANGEYWYIHDAATWQQRTSNIAGCSNTAGASFDASNVKYAVFQVPMDTMSYLLNIGEIYGKKSDGSFVKLFDPAQSVITDTVSNVANSVYVSAWVSDKPAATSDYEVRKMRAGEVVFTEAVTTQWVTLPMAIPEDISAYNGISYEVDLTGCTSDLFINKYVSEYSDGEKENWYSNEGKAMFYPENGEPYSSHTNVIPAGFKGKIVVAFCAFIPNKGAETKDGVMDLSVTGETLGFTVNTKYNNTQFVGNFTIKDVKLVSDAQVEYYVMQCLRRPDGRFNEVVMVKQTATAGAPAYQPQAEIENYQNTGLTCILDEDMPAALTGEEAYYSAGVCRPYRIADDGVVSWDYRPRLYYRNKDSYVIEKVFGLDNLPTKLYHSETVEEDVMALLPQDGITVGNSGKGLLQITGSWTVTVEENSLVAEFVPGDDLPAWLVDSNNLLTRTVALTDDPADQPTEPTQPTDPTDPTEPPQPTDPTDPTEPPQPTDPTDPTDPTNPTKPTEPTAPADDPVEPGESKGSGVIWVVVVVVVVLLAGAALFVIRFLQKRKG